MTETKHVVNDLHKELIERCKAGDLRAQHRLFDLYVKAMYNTVYRILSNSMAAEDAVQEGFLKAFSALDSFKQESSFGHWLKRIMINTALNALRKSRGHDLELTDSIDDLSEAEEPAEQGETEMPAISTILDTIKTLPAGCRIIFTLHLLEGMEQREVAKTLDVSLSTVKTQYRRAKMLLRDRLAVTSNN